MSLGPTASEHPGVNFKEVIKLPIEEIQIKLKDIIQKQNFAIQIGQVQMIQQLQMLREIYTRAQIEKLDAMFGNSDNSEELEGKIDIS